MERRSNEFVNESLDVFFQVVDPTSVNQQGNDRGSQYRSGIYYVDESGRAAAETAVVRKQEKYGAPIATEVLPLENFYMYISFW